MHVLDQVLDLAFLNPPLYFRHILDFDAQSWKHYTFDNVLFHLPLPRYWPKENMYWNWLLLRGSQLVLNAVPPPPLHDLSRRGPQIETCFKSTPETRLKAILRTLVSKLSPKSNSKWLQNGSIIDISWKVKTALPSRREAHSHSAGPLRILSKPTSLSIPYQTSSFYGSRE